MNGLKREGGENPPRSRRRNRGRKPHYATRLTTGEGGVSRLIREPEDLPDPAYRSFPRRKEVGTVKVAGSQPDLHRPHPRRKIGLLGWQILEEVE